MFIPFFSAPSVINPEIKGISVSRALKLTAYLDTGNEVMGLQFGVHFRRNQIFILPSGIFQNRVLRRSDRRLEKTA
jgi:hypothetical protein